MTVPHHDCPCKVAPHHDCPFTVAPSRLPLHDCPFTVAPHHDCPFTVAPSRLPLVLIGAGAARPRHLFGDRGASRRRPSAS
eukprot:2096937-Prymnesium_polylepis.1